MKNRTISELTTAKRAIEEDWMGAFHADTKCSIDDRNRSSIYMYSAMILVLDWVMGYDSRAIKESIARLKKKEPRKR